MPERIPLSVPNLKGNELKYVTECIETEWISSVGSYVEKFEKEFASYLNIPNAVAVVNGTSALHLSLIGCGVQPGDEILAPTLTFIAPINTIRYMQAAPVFMDCDEYFNIDPVKTLEFLKNETTQNSEGLTINKKSGKIIRAIIPVHIWGNAIQADELFNVCRSKNIKIIEDATESLGTYYTKGKYSKKYTGTISDAGCFSFNGNKIITCGGGGMIVCQDSKLAARMKYLSTQAKEPGVDYIHNEIGYNYRLTNLQAAVGVAQLEQIEQFIKIKEAHYSLYQQFLKDIPGLILRAAPPYSRNNKWFFAIEIDNSDGKYPLSGEQLQKKLAANYIETRPIWMLNHQQKPYLKYQNYKIEKAEYFHSRILNLPCSINLTQDNIKYICKILKSV